jgi:membrane protease YdiL (CAAX protease family)
MNSKTPLLVSIAAIVLYWIFAATIANRESIPPADDLGSIVGSILLIKLVTLAIILALLKFEEESLENIGLRSSGMVRKIMSGAALGIVIWIIIHILINPAIKVLIPANEAHRVDMSVYFQKLSQLMVWIPLVIFAGGFVEELQRIFILTRFEKWLKTPGLIISLVIGTIVFGMGHLYQGPNSAISAGISGLLFACVYLRKRSAWEAVSAHAVYDVVGVVVGFLVSSGR